MKTADMKRIRLWPSLYWRYCDPAPPSSSLPDIAYRQVKSMCSDREEHNNISVCDECLSVRFKTQLNFLETSPTGSPDFSKNEGHTRTQFPPPCLTAAEEA